MKFFFIKYCAAADWIIQDAFYYGSCGYYKV